MSSHAQQNDIDDFFSSDRVAGREEAVELEDSSFRDHLIPLDDPTLADVRGMDYEQFTADRMSAPFLRDLLDFWKGLYDEPFVGVTADGVLQDVWRLDTGEPAGEAAAAAASALLESLSPALRAALSHPLDAPQWRS